MYLDWCWRECDRLIYNVYERKEGDKEWLPGDELNDPDSPGETLALQEVYGLNNIKLKRFPHTSRVSYFVVE